MDEYLELILVLTPFIFGLIAIALIPGKEKILEGKVQTYRVEVLIVVYIIALFILFIGFYYFMFMFSETTGNNLLNILNGAFLTIIALGIMGVNHRNHSIEVATAKTSPVDRTRVQPPSTIKPPEFQMVGCPQCGHAIKVNVANRPVKMSCPNCGIEGMVQ